jgi:hypothetical protein
VPANVISADSHVTEPLGLPKEPLVDADIPFRQVKVNRREGQR